MKLMLTETKSKIESLGWHVIAAKKHAGGVSFDATNYKRLAKGEASANPDEAMESCYRKVLELSYEELGI